MDPFHLLSKQQEDQYADADEEGNSHHSSSSSSGFDDDDPRLQSLFATEPYPRPSKAAAAAAAPTAAQSSSPFMIDQNALMDCFEWTVSQYPLTEEDLGFWVAPNEKYADDDEEDARIKVELQAKIAKWKPASMNLPSWAIPKSNGKSEDAC
mmetsp:Transcript_11136/g.24821  ORF Transcript_11136/g.24821 Transcript_11136/m.24821 type:complete len:152 (+) Transcript_11136:74-529(+)